MRAGAGPIRDVDGIGHARQRLGLGNEVGRIARGRRHDLGGDRKSAGPQAIPELVRPGGGDARLGFRHWLSNGRGGLMRSEASRHDSCQRVFISVRRRRSSRTAKNRWRSAAQTGYIRARDRPTSPCVRGCPAMPLLENKVCVVTGGAGSIGLASARLFLREGAKVMLVDLEEADLERATRELGNPSADWVAADVGDAAATQAYVERAVDRFGPIDVLFSNAGNQGPVVPVTDYPEDAFDAQIRVHVRGAFLACKHGLPRMRDGGSVIITSSV